MLDVFVSSGFSKLHTGLHGCRAYREMVAKIAPRALHSSSWASRLLCATEVLAKFQLPYRRTEGLQKYGHRSTVLE